MANITVSKKILKWAMTEFPTGILNFGVRGELLFPKFS